MNRIPKSLEQPFLKDAIVELWFSANVKPELLPGIFYERLRGNWMPPKASPIEALGQGFNIKIQEELPTTFSRNLFKLSVNPTSVVFNVNGKYPGWSTNYYPLLEETLPVLIEGEVVSPHRTSIRYVNHIPTDNLFELINRYKDGITSDWKEHSQTVRSVVFRDGVKAVINLTMNQNFINAQEQPYSIVDIALHKQLTQNKSPAPEELLNFFSELHRLNKEILFGELLPEDFVTTFGPRY